jgi:hypothetical protein
MISASGYVESTAYNRMPTRPLSALDSTSFHNSVSGAEDLLKLLTALPQLALYDICLQLRKW